MQTPAWIAHLPSWLAHPSTVLVWGFLIGVPFVFGLFFGKGWGTVLFVLLWVVGVAALLAVTQFDVGILLVVAMGGGVVIIFAGVIGLWAGSTLRRRLQNR